MNHINDIIAYEQGEMDQDEMIAFFQRLINDGTCWSLQGHYGRTASALIEAGHCQPPNSPASAGVS